VIVTLIARLPAPAQTAPASTPPATTPPATTSPASTPPAAKPEITESWDQLLQGGIPQANTDPVLLKPQIPVSRSFAGDLLNHLFFETRTDYYRYSSSFTGQPTVTGVIDVPSTGIFNPSGIPDPAVFQPSANRIESFVDFGTRGWLSDRVNTHFAFRYFQDITHVDSGAPAENITETSPQARSIQFLTGSVDIEGKPTDGIFAGTNLTLGRQYVYGAELATVDGANFTLDRPQYQFTIFGGRRFSNFGDPDQRAIGGAGINFKLDADTSLELQTLWYIKGSNRASFRHRFNSHWLVTSGFRAYGGAPVDFSTQAIYTSSGGKTTVRASFFQKLSSRDYTYDYTVSARDLDPNNPLLRLYLGQISPYSQGIVDARRTLLPNLRVGASVWLRHLNRTSDIGPYDTSFQDYKGHVQYFPWKKIETYFEYHQRNSDRLNPANPTTFDDIADAGETSVKDMTGEIRRSFGEGRFNLSGGVYYRRISLQDRFYYLNGLHQSGWLTSAWVKVDQHTRIFADYSLDNDFFLFTPDLKNSRVLRIGMAWKY
jgi:hypothetical protein